MADKYEIIIKKNGEVKSQIETNCALIVCNHSEEKCRAIRFASAASANDMADVFSSAMKAIEKNCMEDPAVGLAFMVGALLQRKGDKKKENPLDLDFFRKLKFSESDNEEGGEE